MVDDGQNIRLLQPGNRLGRLVVVHQHHLLAPGLDEVVPGEGAHHPLLGIQNGIAPVAALLDHLLNVIDIVVQVEGGDGLLPGQTAHGDGLEDPADRAVAVIGGRDDTGPAGILPDAVGQLRLTKDDAGHAEIHRPAEHFRLVAADQYGVLLPEGGQLRGLGQGQHHLARDGVHHLGRFPQQLTLQNAEDVKEGNLPQPGTFDGLHVVGRDVPRRHHAAQSALVVGDGDG